MLGSCLNGNRYAYPRQVFNLEAGKHYELYCDIQREKGFSGIPTDKSAMLGIRDLTVTDLVTAQEDTLTIQLVVFARFQIKYLAR